MEYQSDLENHDKERAERVKLMRNLHKKKPRNLDDSFHEAHEKVFQKVDCLKCANCCKTTSPIFRDVDISRIAKKLRVTSKSFEQDYLQRDVDNDWVLKSAPCTFLDADNTCSIYEVRPLACREYPHTNRKRMIQVMDLTLKNADICPAVSRIIGELIIKYP